MFVARQTELAQVDSRIKKLVDAIAEGAPHRALSEQISALEARQDDLRARLTSPAPIAPRLHPNLPDIYRKKVAALADAIMADDTRAEAFELIRSLVEEVRLVPEDGKLAVELRGNLAGILQLCSESKKAASGEAAFLAQVKLVAGAGFEPAAFRL